MYLQIYTYVLYQTFGGYENFRGLKNPPSLPNQKKKEKKRQKPTGLASWFPAAAPGAAKVAKVCPAKAAWVSVGFSGDFLGILLAPKMVGFPNKPIGFPWLK